jgi:hypothetical protein
MLASILAALLINVILFLISLLVFKLIRNKSIETTMRIWGGAMFGKLILLFLFILFIAKPMHLITSAFGITFGASLFCFLIIEILLLNNQKI